MEGCVCRKLPPWPPHHPSFGGGWGTSTFFTSYIYSPAAVGGGRFTRAFMRPPVGPGAPPLYGGPGHGSDFPYKVGHPDWPRDPVRAVLAHSNPLFHTLCSTSLSRPPFSFRCCPVLCLPRPPLLLFSVAVPTPPIRPNTPQQCPVPHRGLPRTAHQTFTGTPPGLYLDL